MKLLGGFAWRLIRVAASLGIAAATAAVADNSALLWLAPVISAAAKALREKFGLTNIPL